MFQNIVFFFVFDCVMGRIGNLLDLIKFFWVVVSVVNKY